MSFAGRPRCGICKMVRSATKPHACSLVSDPNDYFDAHVTPEPNTGCWLWTGAGRGSNGYGSLSIGPRGRRRPELAHRFSFLRFVGPIPSGLFVCHRCDNPSCVNPAHFFLGDHRDNARDMASKGRGGVARGESAGKAKLTEREALEVRALRGVRTQVQLAQRYGIHPTSVFYIQSGRNWRHLSGSISVADALAGFERRSEAA